MKNQWRCISSADSEHRRATRYAPHYWRRRNTNRRKEVKKKQRKRKMKYHNRCAHGESIVLYELIGGFHTFYRTWCSLPLCMLFSQWPRFMEMSRCRVDLCCKPIHYKNATLIWFGISQLEQSTVNTSGVHQSTILIRIN